MPVSTIIWAANRAEVAELLKVSARGDTRYPEVVIAEAGVVTGGGYESSSRQAVRTALCSGLLTVWVAWRGGITDEGDLTVPLSLLWPSDGVCGVSLGGFQMKEQLTRKFGQAFVDKAMANEGGVVNERVLHKLTISVRCDDTEASVGLSEGWGEGGGSRDSTSFTL
jgi:hypothetical protein